MCTGRVDLAFVLRAFIKGVDGVFIGGCRLNECNYVTHGNYYARNMVFLCKKIMEHIGLNPERLSIEFMSAGEGILFAEVMNEFGSRVNELGPLGESEGIEPTALKQRLQEIAKLVPYIKLVTEQKLGSRLERVAEDSQLFTVEEIESLFRGVPTYHIDPQKCQACMICFRKCPVEAIEGGKNRIHVIDQEKCIKCGTCYDACPPRFGAVVKVAGEAAPPPLSEEERTIVRKRQKD
jgi:coenzyme F420-reducing hydrogenase delta subunit/ferredoxin